MILVLGDIRGVVIAFQSVLKRLHMPSMGAGTVAEARVLLPLEHWTGFILELDLPDGSGLDVLEDIRSRNSYQGTPAVVVTADILLDPNTRARVAAAGATLEFGVLATPDVHAICQRLIIQ